MRLNERSVAHYATCDTPPDKTGFLFKKGERNPAYHRRWFVLKANMLFYFEERDTREPVGVIVLEGCTVELCESAEEFAFAIKFDCAKARVYKMAAESQAAMESWVKALSRASFDYMRLVVKVLERQLEEIQEAVSGGSSAASASGGGLSQKNLPDEPQQTSEAPKESRATWDKAAAVTNGCAEAASSCVPWEGRRGASLEIPVPPGTGCFSKLHSRYGREVEELRVQWLQ
uniref:Sesquipedalian n=1 Tax=Tetraodon nigroviridis TaxID=99883 RepID=H3BZX1_TETNG